MRNINGDSVLYFKKYGSVPWFKLLMSSFISVLLPEPLSANKNKQKIPPIVHCARCSRMSRANITYYKHTLRQGYQIGKLSKHFWWSTLDFLGVVSGWKNKEIERHWEWEHLPLNRADFQVPQTVVYKVLAIKFKIVGEHGSREFDIWVIFNWIAFCCLKNFSFFVFSFMSTLNFGTIMKMIFDDKSYIIFAKHRTTVRWAKIEQNIQTVLDILCRFVMISKAKLRRGIMLRNIFWDDTIFIYPVKTVRFGGGIPQRLEWF